MYPHSFEYVSFSTVQERLTKQIATAISEALEPAGVAVVIEAVWVFNPFIIHIVLNYWQCIFCLYARPKKKVIHKDTSFEII